jgi:hypothetical protein
VVRRLTEASMAAPAERMKTTRERRLARGLREVRLVVPDARAASVRKRVAAAAARLQRASEIESLTWIERVSEFDANTAR